MASVSCVVAGPFGCHRCMALCDQQEELYPIIRAAILGTPIEAQISLQTAGRMGGVVQDLSAWYGSSQANLLTCFLTCACCLVVVWLSQLTRCCLSFSIPVIWLVGGGLDFEQGVVDFLVLIIIPACASLCVREWRGDLFPQMGD